jgi:hypothetical protein
MRTEFGQDGRLAGLNIRTRTVGRLPCIFCCRIFGSTPTVLPDRIGKPCLLHTESEKTEREGSGGEEVHCGCVRLRAEKG